MLKDYTSKISTAFAHISNRYAPAFITFILLAGFFFYYFNVIVSANEADLKERKFRGLHRVASNLNKKFDDYLEKNVPNFIDLLTKRTDSSAVAFAEQEYGLKREKIVKKPDSTSIRMFRNSEEGEKLYFKDSASNLVSVEFANFIKSVLRHDLFDGYMLAFNDTIVYDDFNISHQIASDYFAPSKLLDSVIKGKVKQSGLSMQVEIAGKQFKALAIPFTVKGKYRFYVGGYIPMEDYEAERKYIPPYAILWMVIGIVLVVLMIPLLKIFLMHPSEQLVTRNAAAALASLHILSSVFILAALNTFIYFTVVRPATEDNLKELAINIEKTFREEVNSALTELDSAKSAISRGLPLKDIAYNRKLGQFQDNYNRPFQAPDSPYYPGKIYPFFKHIVLTDSSGVQRYRWTTDENLVNKISIKDRDYFLAVRDQNLWSRNTGGGYYMTTLSSWTSHKKLALVTIPLNFARNDMGENNNLLLASLSGRFRSIFKTVLPYGFGFCIVDKNGMVLFHKEENRNLSENIVQECNKNGILQSLLQNRTEGYFGSRYSGSNQRFYTRPLRETPYSVITFKDMKQVWSEDLDVISTCSIMILINLAVILLGLIIIQTGSYKQEGSKKRTFVFTWLRPDDRLKNDYALMCLYYLCSMILMITFFLGFNKRDPLHLIGSSLSYSFILISTTYHRFAVKRNEDVIRYSRNKRILIVLSTLYLICAFLFCFNLSSGSTQFWVVQLAILGTYGLLTLIPYKRLNIYLLNNVRIGKSFRWWYTICTFTFISATSIVPLLIFYGLSYTEERLMSLKHAQWEFAQKISEDTTDLFGHGIDTINLSYVTPFHYSTLANKIYRVAEIKMPDSTADEFEYFYRSIKPSFSYYNRKMETLKGQQGDRSEFSWTEMDNHSQIQFQYRLNKYQDSASNKDGIGFSADKETILLRPESAVTNGSLPFILLVSGVLGILSLFYTVLNNLIRKIFFKGFSETNATDDIERSIRMKVPYQGNIFVYGPASSGKYRTIQEYIAEIDGEMKEVDLNELKTKDALTVLTETVGHFLKNSLQTNSKKQVILIQNIESFLSDRVVTEKKFVLLEGLLNKNFQLIMLSPRSMESLSITKCFENQTDAKDYTNRWLDIMHSFYTLYHRWKMTDDTAKDSATKQLHHNLVVYVENSVPKKLRSGETKKVIYDEVSGLIRKTDQECRHGDFLWSLRNPLKQYLWEIKDKHLSSRHKLKDKMTIIKAIRCEMISLQESMWKKTELWASNYYYSIWHSLTKDEQRTLYDIALDELVNPGNREMAVRLAELGLVSRIEGLACYNIMNVSFRNFIFDEVNKNEIKSFKQDVAEKGFWRSYQLPVLIVIFAVSIFIFISQREAFDNLVAYLGAGVAGIAGLVRLVSIIPSSKS